MAPLMLSRRVWCFGALSTWRLISLKGSASRPIICALCALVMVRRPICSINCWEGPLAVPTNAAHRSVWISCSEGLRLSSASQRCRLLVSSKPGRIRAGGLGCSRPC